MAADDGKLTKVQTLLGCPSMDINYLRNDKTPLFVSSQNGHLDVVKEILSHPQTDVNKGQISEGTTPLHAHGAAPLFAASRKGHLEVVKELLADARVDPNVQCGRYNRTSLMRAIQRSKINVVELLLRCPRVDITLKDNQGDTALEIATDRGKHSYVSVIQSRPTLLQEGHTCSQEQGEYTMILRICGTQKACSTSLLSLQLSSPKLVANIFTMPRP